MKVTGLRSDTCLSMKEFADWLGSEIFHFNGIDFTNSNCDNCKCLLENPYDSKGFFSRTELRELVKRAENIFTNEAERFPCATQIYDERHKYSLGKNGFLTKGFQLKTVKLNWNCDDITLGIAKFLSRGDVDITAIITDAIANSYREVEIEITLPAANFRSLTDLQDRVLLLFDNDDLNRGTESLDLNNIRKFGVRPYEMIEFVDDSGGSGNVIITFVVSLALLKKPSLDNNTVCLANEAATYVTSLELFEMYIDKCEQGKFYTSDYDCSTVPCTKLTIDLCASESKCGCGKCVSPEPLSSCTYDGATDTYTFVRPSSINSRIEEVGINYISGDPLSCFRIKDDIKDAIFKIAVGISPLKKAWCPCDISQSSKWDYYRGHNVAITGKSELSGGDYDTNYQVILSKENMEMANGYNPTRGFLEGMRDITDYFRCCTVEGYNL